MTPMTEGRISEIDEALEKNNVTLSQLVNQDEELELLSLARLGLWARQYGVPALKRADRVVGYVPSGDSTYKARNAIDDALAKLPKGDG